MNRCSAFVTLIWLYKTQKHFLLFKGFLIPFFVPTENTFHKGPAGWDVLGEHICTECSCCMSATTHIYIYPHTNILSKRWFVFDPRCSIDCQSYGIKFSANTELGNTRCNTFINVCRADCPTRDPGCPWYSVSLRGDISAPLCFILRVFRAIALE